MVTSKQFAQPNRKNVCVMISVQHEYACCIYLLRERRENTKIILHNNYTRAY